MVTLVEVANNIKHVTFEICYTFKVIEAKENLKSKNNSMTNLILNKIISPIVSLVFPLNNTWNTEIIRKLIL